MVARSVVECLNDFIKYEFPLLIEQVFNNANGLINKLDFDSSHLQSDIRILSDALKKIISVCPFSCLDLIYLFFTG